MPRLFYAIISILSLSVSLLATDSGSGIIEGRIYNSKNNEPLPFANIVIWGTTIGTVSDLDGRFLITGVNPGYVNLVASSVGFDSFVTGEFLVTNARRSYIEIALTESLTELTAAEVRASPFRRNDDSPVSLRRIGVAEIEKNPGGNRDISKVIQSFPGVSSTPAYRNDVIVRGGGPSESKFYLDGIEIPNLNHFSTQGASGGPVGIINVDFIREINFYSGAFPANRGNVLSGLLDFRMVDGNTEKTKFRGTIGASDLALTLDGPISQNTAYILSARRSYLQFLFSALGLPFLPTYNDFQFKVRSRLNEKNEITLIGLGAIDQFALNLKANQTPEQRFILSFLPVNEQWNYTVGAVYRHFRETGSDSWVVSRNFLNNEAYKYTDNNESLPRTFDYASQEAENKFRFERNSVTTANYRINVGVSFEYAIYTNRTSRKIFSGDKLINASYQSAVDMVNYGLFGQVSRSLVSKQLTISAGARLDGSSYSRQMVNPLEQLSPRLSVSYQLSEALTLNASSGRYYQRPPYTALGFKNNNGRLVNRDNGIRYILSDQVVAGVEYSPNSKSRVTIEGFYKYYRNYPFSVTDSVALATKGADFGSFGDEALVPLATGRAYGVEFFGRTLDLYRFNIILSYTLVWSEFNNIAQRIDKVGYIPTTWDNRQIINLTSTRSFKRNWDVGFKWRFVGAAPYTPFDAETSSVREAWDATGAPYLDFSRFNQLRLKPFHQLDIRVDKSYFFNKWSLMVYVDIQNLYNFKAFEPDRLIRESFLYPLVNDLFTENGVERYRLTRLPSDGTGTILPTIGIIVEF